MQNQTGHHLIRLIPMYYDSQYGQWDKFIFLEGDDRAVHNTIIKYNAKIDLSNDRESIDHLLRYLTGKTQQVEGAYSKDDGRWREVHGDELPFSKALKDLCFGYGLQSKIKFFNTEYKHQGDTYSVLSIGVCILHADLVEEKDGDANIEIKFTIPGDSKAIVLNLHLIRSPGIPFEQTKRQVENVLGKFKKERVGAVDLLDSISPDRNSERYFGKQGYQLHQQSREVFKKYEAACSAQPKQAPAP